MAETVIRLQSNGPMAVYPRVYEAPETHRIADDMELRRLSRATQHNYLQDVGRLADWLGRPTDTASREELRQFKLDQREAWRGGPNAEQLVSAPRFFYTHRIDQPDLTGNIYRVKHLRSLPTVLGREEMIRMLTSTIRLNHQAILSAAFGTGLNTYTRTKHQA